MAVLVAPMDALVATRTPCRPVADPRPGDDGIRDRAARGYQTQDDDADLLTRIGAGDADALSCLYERYKRATYSLARHLLNDAAAAEDVMQDVFLAIWRGAGAYDAGRGSARSWILAQAHHKSVDALRRRRLRTAPPLDERLADERDFADDALGRIAQERVRRALDKLSPAQRQAVILAYYGGHTQQEIADRLHVPLGTVKTRIRDAMLKLRGLLSAEIVH